MLEKLLNKKVVVGYTYYTTAVHTVKGILTAINEQFIEIDNKTIIAIKYIVEIKDIEK